MREKKREVRESQVRERERERERKRKKDTDTCVNCETERQKEMYVFNAVCKNVFCSHKKYHI